MQESTARGQRGAKAHPGGRSAGSGGSPGSPAGANRAFGSPTFQRGGARVDDVLERFWAGESIDELTEEFGVPADQLEDVLRAASRRAA